MITKDKELFLFILEDLIKHESDVISSLSIYKTDDDDINKLMDDMSYQQTQVMQRLDAIRWNLKKKP